MQSVFTPLFRTLEGSGIRDEGNGSWQLNGGYQVEEKGRKVDLVKLRYDVRQKQLTIYIREKEWASI